MATLLPEGKQSFNVATGAPLVGGKLYTYDAGTNNPRTTWSDSAGTVPNTNPIILDARGEATIFWSGSYKVILKDSLDNTIWTVDGVQGSEVQMNTDLASFADASKGAGMIGFNYALGYGANTIGKWLKDLSLPAGAGFVGSSFATNYVASTIGNDLRYGSIPSIFKVLSQAQQQDVLNYTFAQDLTATIAAALLLCKTWYFPTGGYKLSDELTVSTGYRLIGDSNANRYYGAQPTTGKSTKFWQSTAGKAVFKIGVGVSEVLISDMELTPVQNPAPYTAYTANTFGIKMEGVNYVAAGNALQQAGRSSYKITLQRLTGYQFERFISCADYYWDLGSAPPNGGTDWQCDTVTVNQCVSYSCLHGIYLNTTNADAWTINNTTAAVWTNGAGITLKRSGYITGNACYWTPNESAAGVLCTATEGVKLDGYWDSVTLVGCSASDGIAYAYHITSAVGYDNVYQPLTTIGCVFEGPCLVEKQRKIVSLGSRYTDDVTCSGDDIEVHSSGDGWFPTTKKFVMNGLRSRLFVHGGSTQTSGFTNCASGVATTVFTLPISAGSYNVQAWITGNTPYMAEAFIQCEGSQMVRVRGTNTGVSISVSGLNNIQVTQTFGSAQNVQWTWQRVA